MTGRRTPRSGDTGWMARAACRHVEVDMFPTDRAGVDEAVQVCEECPVRRPCLDYALGLRVEHGVWGGLSERARVRARKRRVA